MSDPKQKIRVTLTRQRALQLGLLVCTCGHPENNHFDWDDKICAFCSCKAYTEQGVSGVEVERIP